MRDYQIQGAYLVMVKFGAHVVSGYIPGAKEARILGADLVLSAPTPQLYELGLPEGKIVITPKFIHKNVVIDEFGPDSTAEVRTMCHEIKVDMTLIHYDQWVLDAVIDESMGGGPLSSRTAGVLPPAGQTLGRGLAPRSSGCHYMSLSLLPTIFGNVPWRFPTAYLTSEPLDIPIGTEKSMVRLVWRGITYTSYANNAPGDNALPASGLVLWDHETEEVDD